jgi:type II secretory pathway component PulF
MLTSVLLSLSPALYVIAAVLLVRRYLRTRDAGLLWLGAAVLVWPYMSMLLERGELRLVLRSSVRLMFGEQMTSGNLYTLFQSLNHLIGAGLTLLAILYLTKNHASGDPSSQPA